MQKLWFGMIGGAKGFFIGDIHRKGAQLDDMAQLVAGCFSRNEENNQATACDWGVDKERVYSSYQEMAEKEQARADGIDFVVIVTTNNTHYAIAKCFLEHGIHVSCDKPVSLEISEAIELRELAIKKGLHFGVSYTYVNYPLVNQMRTMIKEGSIGDILTVMAEYPQDWVINAVSQGTKVEDAWRFNPKVAGNSASTADIGTHLECLMHFCTGLKIERVLANLTPIPKHLPLETNTQVLCKLENDIPAMMWASQVAYGHECSVSLRVFGSKGALEWTHDNPNCLKYTQQDGPITLLTSGRNFLANSVQKMSRIAYGHPEGFFEAFGTYYKSFCQEINFLNGLGPAPDYPHPTIEDGIRGLAFKDACIKSNENNNIWIDIK